MRTRSATWSGIALDPGRGQRTLDGCDLDLDPRDVLGRLGVLLGLKRRRVASATRLEPELRELLTRLGQGRTGGDGSHRCRAHRAGDDGLLGVSDRRRGCGGALR